MPINFLFPNLLVVNYRIPARGSWSVTPLTTHDLYTHDLYYH